MLPAAPVLFSTMNDWPKRSEKRCASLRAMMSTMPPGGNADTIVTGRSG
jgi:hypothetical protein